MEVIGIPHYNRNDLLTRCIVSVGSEFQRVVVIQNGIELPELPPWVHAYRQPGIGFAGAANWLIKSFPAPFWFICGNDVMFRPGDLAAMRAAAMEHAESVALICGNLGMSFFIITARGVQSVGLFDENFHPAYLEDFDWLRRLQLSGEKSVRVDTNALHGLHGECSATIHSDPKLEKANERTYQHNCSYYIQKWGGEFQKETFKTPYNKPGVPIDYWHFMPELRKLQQWP